MVLKDVAAQASASSISVSARAMSARCISLVLQRDSSDVRPEWNNKEKTLNQEELLSQLKLTVFLIAAGSQCICQQDHHRSSLKLITSKESTDRAQEVAFQLFLSARHVVSVHLCSLVAIERGLYKGRERQRKTREQQQSQKVSPPWFDTC